MKFVCTVCGYTYEGEKPPEKCPMCGVGADKFKKLKKMFQMRFGLMNIKSVLEVVLMLRLNKG
ncbi:MAG: hypothetical protein L6V95_04090 [Candidatus Melainabacteria bacterium]|nr:MAG: hypothetical protein L6V95_04090 [Candidatus Melainabacteria bacterium]